MQAASYSAIENSDSDGDGFTNIVEIRALTFPGNANSRPSSGDSTLPTVTNFVIPSTSTALSVAITTFTATDNVGVTGYMVNESSTKPLASAAGWSGSAPTSYAFSSAGAKTLYAWAKDAAGNVSAGLNDSVTITLPVSDATLPTVTNFVIPSTSTALTVAITTFTATDNVGVTGYMVNESSTKPLHQLQAGAVRLRRVIPSQPQAQRPSMHGQRMRQAMCRQAEMILLPSHYPYLTQHVRR